MLTENDIVQTIAAYLKAKNYRIDKTCSTIERGIDIVAVHRKTGKRLLVEVKGGTSSKSGTARYGEPFTRNQVKTHISAGLYCAARLRQKYLAEGAAVALAFPDDSNHREIVGNIYTALKELGIKVFFVDEHRHVNVNASVTS